MLYDIIGDIHGEADKLTALLTRLGYRPNALATGAWTHPERQAVFVGDLVDRGPGQLEALGIVRKMIDAGSAHAVMGNHELNAIAFFLEDPERPGHHLRSRNGSTGAKNRKQHRAFLDAVGEDSPLHKEWVTWFTSLPLFLQLPGGDGKTGIRVAHACWDQVSIDSLSSWLAPGNRLTFDHMPETVTRGTPITESIDVICKGPEIRLPTGRFYLDGEGSKRTKTRIQWWKTEAMMFHDLALLPGDELVRLPNVHAGDFRRPRFDPSVPTFFGHYWLSGTPSLMAPSLACLDYSVAKGGDLVAYRWDGEGLLDVSKFVSTGRELTAGPQSERRRTTP